MRATFGLVTVVAVGIGLAGGCQRRTDPAPPGSSRPPTRPEPRVRRADFQTTEELAARLARAGITVSVRNRPLLNRLNRTAVAISDDFPGEPATVFVYHCQDEADAREQVDAMGAEAFACGRFAIGTRGEATARDRELLTRIETVLNQPIGAPAITRVE